MFDANLLVLVGVLAALCALAWWQGGEALVIQGFSAGASLLLRFGLVIVISFLAAGFVEALIPQACTRLSRHIATGSSSTRTRRQAGSQGRSQVRPRMPGNTLDSQFTI